MRTIRKLVLLTSCVASLYATTTLAQTPLDAFLDRPGVSPLQNATGTAVSRICPRLGGTSQGGAQADLFLRCNELIGSASLLLGGSPNRHLGITDPNDLLAALQQVSGEELLGQTTLSTRVTNGQFSNIAGRLNAVRLGSASSALGGQVASLASPYDNSDRRRTGIGAMSMDSRGITGGAAAADVSGNRLGWFLEGSLNTGDHDQTVNEDAFDFDATSFTLGLDYLFDSGVIGVSAGIDNYEADFATNPLVAGGTVEVEGTSGSIFGALFRGNFYFDGIASFGSIDSDTARSVVYMSNNPGCPVGQACTDQNDTLLGETDGEYIAAGATIGFDANPGGGRWDVSTTLSLAYRDIDIDSYSETDAMGGGLSLSFADQKIESLRTILGVAFTGNFSRAFGVLSPQLRLEWHHEFEDDPVDIIAKYAIEDQLAVQGVMGAAGAGVFSLNTAQCLSCFRILSDQIDTDFGLVGVGLSAVFSQRVQIYGAYDALVGIDNITSNTFSVGIRGQF